MSIRWRGDELLVGKGSADDVPRNPRMRSLSTDSTKLSRGSSPLDSPRSKMLSSSSLQEETMDKAKELFELCDKEGKGFITKQDMQRLQEELPLTSEQLETVFESLDHESNGFLTPFEFNRGLGELMGLDETTELSLDEMEEDRDEMDWLQDPTTMKFVNTLTELGADTLFRNPQDLCFLCCELQSDKPELLSTLEGILSHAVSQLKDAIRERENLQEALSRRDTEHEQVVQSIYEEMQTQIREEKDKWLAWEILKEKQKRQLIEEELKMRELDLESALSKQNELEHKVRQLTLERLNINGQNQQLRSLNTELQEQVENGKEKLEAALSELSMLQSHAALEHRAKQRSLSKVSTNMKKEKDSLVKQLELLRDMNKMLRDERDAQQVKPRNPSTTKPLTKKSLDLANLTLQDKSVLRQLSSSDELKSEKKKEVTFSAKTHQSSSRDRGEQIPLIQTQSHNLSTSQVFKVVFLGNSGVGKTAFIQHFCSGHFSHPTSTTVGIDFRIKTLTIGSTSIILQLWDTAGQERYRSITEQYYRKADGILTMYDVTEPASFTAAREWMDSVKEKMCDGTVLMLLGNKLDLANSHRRKVPTIDGQKLAEQYQTLFHECSAKTGQNIDMLMNHLAELMVSRHEAQWEDAVTLTENTPRRSCCAYNIK